jgi:hypothetical protein
MRSRACLILLILLSFQFAGFAQQKDKTPNVGSPKDLDPLALQVLKAATEPISNAQSLSFRRLNLEVYLCFKHR